MYYFINQASCITIAVVLTFLATVVVLLRLIQTGKNRDSYKPGAVRSVFRTWHLDDLYAILALILCYPFSIVFIWGAANNAMGAHSSPADIEVWINAATDQWITTAKVTWVMFWLQPLILGFAKLSFLHFCRRIFSIFRSFQIVSMIMIVLVWGFMICFTIGLFFDCGSNIAANWGSLAEIGEQCTFGFLPTVIYTIIDAAFDLACLLLPIPWVFKLQMPMTKKISVMGCFFLGGFATAAALVRMVILIESNVPSVSQTRTTVLNLPAYDAVGIVSTDMFVTMIETTVAIIAICLPAIRKIVSLFTFSRLFGISSLGRYYANFRSSNNRSRSNILEIESKTSGNMSDRSTELSHSESRTGLHRNYLDENSIPMGKMRQTTTYRVESFTCDSCGNHQTGHQHETAHQAAWCPVQAAVRVDV